MKKESLPQKILIILSDLLETGIDILVWDYKSLQEKSGISSLYFPPSPLFYKGLSSLKQNKFIKAKKAKNRKEIILTKKAKSEIVKYKLKDKIDNTKWDGKWRGISWDVPEASRKDRDYLRRQLKWIGFKELQKSFWIFPYDIKKEMENLFQLYKNDLMGDIRFLVIEKIEDDSDLKKYFKLR